MSKPYKSTLERVAAAEQPAMIEPPARKDCEQQLLKKAARQPAYKQANGHKQRCWKVGGRGLVAQGLVIDLLIEAA